MKYFYTRTIKIFLAWCLCCASSSASDAHLLTLNLQDVPLRDALQVLADELEMNLVLSDEVTGDVSVHVEQLDIVQTLDVLLFGKNLFFRMSHNLLAVGPLHHLSELDQAQQQRKLAAAVLQTEYMQLNYADAKNVLLMLTGPESVARSAADSARPYGLMSLSGSAQVDARTNTLIVRDEPERLQAIRDLLSVLDVPVRQVLIEAKIVSAALDTGRELGVRWGLSGLPAGSMVGDDVSAQLIAGNLDLAVAADHRAASVARIGLMRDQRVLDIEISALERAGEAELIARPRVTTQDNMPALIQSGVRIPYQAQAGGTAGGSTTEFVDALLSLDVTPLITPDGRIIMRLNIRQDSVASGSGEVPAINTNTITTSVLVDNGETLVLGGIFREEQTRAETGTPGLRRIPVLGALFRRRVAARHRTELLIFITPEILHESSPELVSGRGFER
ncbi:MAG: type IV pilus secretin PilQ [Pseudohongiella sp.]|nr:type IV pilus secretin PilQ [Pseudohongiella sp.]